MLLVTASGSAPAEPAPTSTSELAASDGAGPNAERVVLVARTPGDDGVVTRLRAELAENDWRVVEVPLDGAGASTLAELAEREHASAAVRVEARRGVIELWVHRPDGAVEETLDASGERRSESVLALRVVEALRARGLRIEKAPAEAPRAPEPPVPAALPERGDAAPVPPEASARSVSTRLWLDLGPGLLVSPGGLGSELVVDAALRIELASHWSFGASGLVPLATRSVEGPEGEASVATWMVGGSIELAWLRFPFGGVRSGLGVGAAVTTMAGDADQGFTSADATVTSLAPDVRSSFRVALGQAFTLRAGVALGLTIPEVSIVFGERTAATWGRPFVAAGLALETSPLSW